MSDTEKKLRKNKLILIISASALLIFAIAYTIYFNLSRGTEREIVCVIKETFGIYCPGCGGSRSLSKFMKLDILGSFIMYPPIPIAAAVVISYYIRLALSIIKKDIKYTEKYRFYPFIIIAVSIILTFIVRNIHLLAGIDLLGDILG